MPIENRNLTAGTRLTARYRNGPFMPGGRRRRRQAPLPSGRRPGVQEPFGGGNGRDGPCLRWLDVLECGFGHYHFTATVGAGRGRTGSGNTSDRRDYTQRQQGTRGDESGGGDGNRRNWPVKRGCGRKERFSQGTQSEGGAGGSGSLALLCLPQDFLVSRGPSTRGLPRTSDQLTDNRIMTSRRAPYRGLSCVVEPPKINTTKGGQW